MKLGTLSRGFGVMTLVALVSCAAKDEAPKSVHPALAGAVRLTAEMPALRNGQWQALGADPKVQALLLGTLKSVQLEKAVKTQSTPTGLADLEAALMAAFAGGSGGGGGGGGSSSPGYSGGSLPSGPAIGGASLPSGTFTSGILPSGTFFTGILAAGPSFTAGGSGGGGSCGDIVDAIVELTFGLAYATASCLGNLEEDYDLEAAKEAYRADVEVALEGIEIPAASLSAICCVGLALQEAACTGDAQDETVIFENFIEAINGCSISLE